MVLKQTPKLEEKGDAGVRFRHRRELPEDDSIGTECIIIIDRTMKEMQKWTLKKK